MTDRVDKIIAYESGDMAFGEIVSFFQELINDGSAWKLQGHYGRTAQELINQGYCTKKPKFGTGVQLYDNQEKP